MSNKYRLLIIVTSLLLVLILTGMKIAQLRAVDLYMRKGESDKDINLLQAYRFGNSQPRKVNKQKEPSISEQIMEYNARMREVKRKLGYENRFNVWPVSDINAENTGSFYEDRGNYLHKGIDIAVPVGTPVKAVLGGKFYKGNQGDKTGFGKYVYIVHNNGLRTYYGHLKEWAAMADGTAVLAGNVIGWSGNSGYSTGPHLHFEIRSKEGNLNPDLVLRKRNL